MNTAKNLEAAAPKPTGTTTKGTPHPEVKLSSVPLPINKAAEPSLEDRLHRLNQLFELQGRYNKLQSSLLKLTNFTFEKNGDYSGITIRDDGRNDFTTGNPEVIEEVVKFLIVTIQKKIKDLEPLLKW